MKRFVQMWVGLMALASVGAAQPAILQLTAAEEVLALGDEVDVEVTLLDVNAEPAPSDEVYEVRLEGRRGGAEGELVFEARVTLSAGRGAVTISPSEAGLLHLQVFHEAFLGRETFVVVEPGASSRTPQKEQQSGGDLSLLLSLFGLANAAQPGASATPDPSLQLDIRYGSSTPYLANGEDAVTLHLFLYDAAGNLTQAPEDVTVRLFSSLGTLTPEVVIPQGSDRATATLSSARAGEAQLEFLGSLPRTTLRSDLPSVTFASSVLRVWSSPPSISLLEPADIVVRLIEAEPREQTISFAVTQGKGVVRPATLTLGAGQREGRARFIPTSAGSVLVSASGRDGEPAEFPIDVTFLLALLWLLLSLAGGLTGAWVAVFMSQKKSAQWRKRRTLVGVITGFVLYWALIFGAVPLVPLTLAGIVLNPFSAVVLSAVGGWLGADVFALITQALKLTRPQPAAT